MWKKYSEDVIACIRAVDREALILVGTPHWDQDVHLAADDPIKNVHNIMYTLHFYAATHKTSLRERADYALEKGLPHFCFRMCRHGSKRRWKYRFAGME